MARMEIRVSVDDARENVRIEIWRDGEFKEFVLLDGSTTENHIQALGLARGQLTEAVAPNLDYGSRVLTLLNPTLKLDEFGGNKVIGIRHPGLGWLSIQIDPASAVQLGEWLLSRATPSPPID